MSVPGSLSGFGAAASGGGAAIPGIGQVLGGLQLISGLGGLFGSKSKPLAQRQQEKLNKLNIKNLEALVPFLRMIQGGATSTINPMLQNAQNAAKYAASYDPAKSTEDLTRTYDMGARESVNRDLGAITANSAARGFTQGTGDSDTGGMISDALARRAAARGAFVSNLKANEPGRYMDVTGGAFNRLQNTFATLDPSGRATGLAGAANSTVGALNGVRQMNDATAFDPTSSIAAISGGLKKVFPKMPWQI